MTWKLPTTFPDLSAAPMIALDLETRDPSIGEKRGPGIHGRDDCYVVGASLATPDGFKAYYPIAHAEGMNLERDAVLDYLRRQLGRSQQPKIGANIMYDLQWLAKSGVKVAGDFHDVQFAEPLLDENARSYSLETIAQKYLGLGKKSDYLQRAALSRGIKDENYRAYIWRFRPDEVGEYAETDCTLLFPIFEKQKKALMLESAYDLYRLECRQIPMLVAMRMRGVRVDTKRAEELCDELLQREIAAQAELDKIAGFPVGVRKSVDLERVRAKLNLIQPTVQEWVDGKLITRKSFSKPALLKKPARVWQLVLEIRKMYDFRTKFVTKYVLDFAINGRIYSEFHPLRKDKEEHIDEGQEGTGMGRTASARPNLQNVPKRDSEFGPEIRKLFLPEEDETWFRNDYKQIEPRVAIHYGRGEKAEDARAILNADPMMDAYSIMSAMMPTLSRDQIKVAYLGTMYGMGEKKFASTYNMSIDQARAIRIKFNTGAPYLQQLSEYAKSLADKTGWVKTIMNRRRHFNTWEPDDYELRKGELPLPYKEAIAKWPNIRLQRAETRVAAHHCVSGSSADILKMAQALIWESGVCDPKILGAPLSLVHDELNFSMPNTPEGAEAMDTVVDLMENAVKLRVPIRVDVGLGKNWGETK